MFRACLFAGCFAALCLLNSPAEELLISDSNPLAMPPVGAHQLRILSPNLLELTLITTEKADAGVTLWNFIGSSSSATLPNANEFSVTVDGKSVAVKSVGFKRRVLYAPLKQRDLRIGNYLYLQLATPIAENQSVTVLNADKKLWPAETHFAAKMDPLRWSPAIHVNEVGYIPTLSKKAMVGFYLGSLGEMDIGNAPSPTNFKLIDAASGKEVFSWQTRATATTSVFPWYLTRKFLKPISPILKHQVNIGCRFPAWALRFLFSLMRISPPRLRGHMRSAFIINVAARRMNCLSRDSSMTPATWRRRKCRRCPARFNFVNETLAGYASADNKNPAQTAPPLKNVAASLYPFVNKGPVDVRGGHHDAGDYSKYTENSAWFIHYLVFAADNFPGAGELDNLGLPESGDGKSDLLQEAKWEADFLAKMQDADGGFYFLVYPREREYEIDVLPDHGDAQIVYPKTTAVTAAAVAALAQCASSPKFKQQFPEAAALYLEKAKKGWAFLDRALAKYGTDGAYQKITHYGDDSTDKDELAWAACELFLATGDQAFHDKLADWLKPSDADTRLWGWWRMYACWGNAIRDYAFAARSGRIKREQLNPTLLADCENEIIATADDQLRRSKESAYGTSFPSETKTTMHRGLVFFRRRRF